jgi:hypothetical protein
MGPRDAEAVLEVVRIVDEAVGGAALVREVVRASKSRRSNATDVEGLPEDGNDERDRY